VQSGQKFEIWDLASHPIAQGPTMVQSGFGPGGKRRFGCHSATASKDGSDDDQSINQSGFCPGGHSDDDDLRISAPVAINAYI